jgi:hypothetical protein
MNYSSKRQTFPCSLSTFPHFMSPELRMIGAVAVYWWWGCLSCEVGRVVRTSMITSIVLRYPMLSDGLRFDKAGYNFPMHNSSAISGGLRCQTHKQKVVGLNAAWAHTVCPKTPTFFSPARSINRSQLPTCYGLASHPGVEKVASWNNILPIKLMCFCLAFKTFIWVNINWCFNWKMWELA